MRVDAAQGTMEGVAGRGTKAVVNALHQTLERLQIGCNGQERALANCGIVIVTTINESFMHAFIYFDLIKSFAVIQKTLKILTIYSSTESSVEYITSS